MRGGGEREDSSWFITFTLCPYYRCLSYIAKKNDEGESGSGHRVCQRGAPLEDLHRRGLENSLIDDLSSSVDNFHSSSSLSSSKARYG